MSLPFTLSGHPNELEGTAQEETHHAVYIEEPGSSTDTFHISLPSTPSNTSIGVILCDVFSEAEFCVPIQTVT